MAEVADTDAGRRRAERYAREHRQRAERRDLAERHARERYELAMLELEETNGFDFRHHGEELAEVVNTYGVAFVRLDRDDDGGDHAEVLSPADVVISELRDTPPATSMHDQAVEVAVAMEATLRRAGYGQTADQLLPGEHRGVNLLFELAVAAIGVLRRLEMK